MDAKPWRPTASRRTLERRAELLRDIRAFMAAHGILEVDTAVLASAAPAERGLDSFAVATAGYLQPSPEHAMKRLLAAGMGPIYQLGHVFRAGEAGRWHNPEFCMLEWYRPLADTQTLMAETAALIAAVADTARTGFQTYAVVFRRYTGIDVLSADTRMLADCAVRHGVAPRGAVDDEPRAFWLDLLMSLVVQPQLGWAGPICVTQFPADDAVLVEHDPADARVAQRFEIYWQGVELANGAQELTDPAAARVRMQGELEARRQTGYDAPPLDEALLAAMQSGLPRCAGVALGVDRLLALTLGCDRLADVLPFDWMRR